MVLDGETLALAPRAAELIAASEHADLPGTLKSELFASALELNTGVCQTAAEGAEALAALRRGAARLAEERGLRLAAAGSHPFSPPEEQEIADEPRYLEFVEYAGVSARRQGVSGLHVHIGMPSAEACFHALEGVLPWLPVVLAWSANSPYLAGEETGLVSNRAEVLCAAAAKRRAAGLSVVRGVGGVRRTLHQPRGGRRLHEVLVGHPAPSAFRHARDPDARPADRARPYGRLRRPPQGPVRRGSRPAATSLRPGRTRDVPAEPLGGLALRARRGARASRRRSGPRSDRSSRPSSRLWRARTGSTPLGWKPTASSRSGGRTASRPSAPTSSRAR